MSNDPNKRVFSIKRDISQHYIKRISNMWGQIKLPIIGIISNPKGDIPNGILGFEVFEMLYKLFRCCTCGNEGWKMGKARSVVFLNALGHVVKDRPDGKLENMFETDGHFCMENVIPVEGDKWIYCDRLHGDLLNIEDDVFDKDNMTVFDDDFGEDEEDEEDEEEDEEDEEEGEEEENENVYPGQEAFFGPYGGESEVESSEESSEESCEEEKGPFDDIDTVLQWIKGTESDTEEEDMERESKRARRV